MTDRDKPAFATMLVAVGEMFNRQLSEVLLELHFNALADLELEAIRRAMTQHIRNQKFFPTPSEIREAVLGSTEDRAELAWAKLLTLVRERGWTAPPTVWEDAAMRRAAMELYGGWQLLCERLPSEGPGFAVAAKQFKATYSAYVREALRSLELPPTREEAMASLSGLKAELERRGLPVGALDHGR